MAIKNSKKLLLISIIYFLLFFGSIGIMDRSTISNERAIPKMNDSNLIDKVYLFQSPLDALLLEDIVLEQYYTYYIWVEIVTPYNCSVKIILWDPNGDQYNIFESSLFNEPEGANYFEIPFGTAKAGNYDIEFEVTTPGNVNVYIKMEQGPKCLFDKIPMEEVDDIRLYRITRFSNADEMIHTIFFDTDYMYKFYVGRVSPITVMENNHVRLDFTLEDPDGIKYNIFSNTSLVDIDKVEVFKFGTAISGVYTFNLTIYCNVAHVNIGYSIVDLYQISSGIEPNQTQPTNGSTIVNQYFEMPTEWTIGILGFAGTISAIIGIVLYKQKKKNVISSGF
ncbi:MAG: hypothetical protein ACXACX_18690 [Candidatus Hodarchaeales archaeon]|jgi:hypothetical protein